MSVWLILWALTFWVRSNKKDIRKNHFHGFYHKNYFSRLYNPVFTQVFFIKIVRAVYRIFYTPAASHPWQGLDPPLSRILLASVETGLQEFPCHPGYNSKTSSQTSVDDLIIITDSVDLLTHRRIAFALSLFRRYYHGLCPVEFKLIMPPPQSLLCT